MEHTVKDDCCGGSPTECRLIGSRSNPVRPRRWSARSSLNSVYSPGWAWSRGQGSAPLSGEVALLRRDTTSGDVAGTIEGGAGASPSRWRHLSISEVVGRGESGRRSLHRSWTRRAVAAPTASFRREAEVLGEGRRLARVRHRTRLLRARPRRMVFWPVDGIRARPHAATDCRAARPVRLQRSDRVAVARPRCGPRRGVVHRDQGPERDARRRRAPRPDGFRRRRGRAHHRAPAMPAHQCAWPLRCWKDDLQSPTFIASVCCELSCGHGRGSELGERWRRGRGGRWLSGLATCGRICPAGSAAIGMPSCCRRRIVFEMARAAKCCLERALVVPADGRCGRRWRRRLTVAVALGRVVRHLARVVRRQPPGSKRRRDADGEPLGRRQPRVLSSTA